MEALEHGERGIAPSRSELLCDVGSGYETFEKPSATFAQLTVFHQASM